MVCSTFQYMKSHGFSSWYPTESCLYADILLTCIRKDIIRRKRWGSNKPRKFILKLVILNVCTSFTNVIYIQQVYDLWGCILLTGKGHDASRTFIKSVFRLGNVHLPKYRPFVVAHLPTQSCKFVHCYTLVTNRTSTSNLTQTNHTLNVTEKFWVLHNFRCPRV